MRAITFRFGWAALLVAAGAVGYALLALTGLAPASDDRPAHVHEAQPRLETPVSNSGRVRAEANGPEQERWALRSFATVDGQVCVQTGQIIGERFGRQLAGRFVDRRLTDSGMCGPGEGPWASLTRHMDDPRTSGHEPPRTVVFGQIRDTASGMVTVDTGDRRYVVEARDGMFLLVLGATSSTQTIRVEMPTPNGGVDVARL